MMISTDSSPPSTLPTLSPEMQHLVCIAIFYVVCISLCPPHLPTICKWSNQNSSPFFCWTSTLQQVTDCILENISSYIQCNLSSVLQPNRWAVILLPAALQPVGQSENSTPASSEPHQLMRFIIWQYQHLFQNLCLKIRLKEARPQQGELRGIPPTPAQGEAGFLAQ